MPSSARSSPGRAVSGRAVEAGRLEAMKPQPQDQIRAVLRSRAASLESAVGGLGRRQRPEIRPGELPDYLDTDRVVRTVPLGRDIDGIKTERVFIDDAVHASAACSTDRYPITNRRSPWLAYPRTYP